MNIFIVILEESFHSSKEKLKFDWLTNEQHRAESFESEFGNWDRSNQNENYNQSIISEDLYSAKAKKIRTIQKLKTIVSDSSL